MTTFFLAPDAHSEPTLWARLQPVLPDGLNRFTVADVPVLRRCDLEPRMRRFWPEIVERMT